MVLKKCIQHSQLIHYKKYPNQRFQLENRSVKTTITAVDLFETMVHTYDKKYTKALFFETIIKFICQFLKERAQYSFYSNAPSKILTIKFRVSQKNYFFNSFLYLSIKNSSSLNQKY